LQQAVAHLTTAAALVHHDKRLVAQMGEQVQHLPVLDVVPRGHGLGGLQRPAAGKNSQPGQEPLFRLGQQIVGPVNQGAKRLLARQGGARPAREQPETIVQTGGDLFRGQQFDARGGQFDGERDAVELMAHLGDRGRVFARQCETGLARHRPIHEKLHGALPGQNVQRWQAARVRRFQGGHRVGGFAGDAQRLAAARQNAHVGAAGQQTVGKPGARLDQVLAVVQHQQERLGPQKIRERVGKAPARLFAHAQNRGDRLGREGGIGQRRQIHKPDAVFVLFDPLGGRLKREPGFAAAAGSDQRKQARGGEPLPNLLDLALAPDKARGLEPAGCGQTLRASAAAGSRCGARPGNRAGKCVPAAPNP
jgi:hypothetical protein